MRLPRNGGLAAAYRWATDSLLWQSETNGTHVERVLAFDDVQGSLAYIDKRGAPGRLELRVRATEAATPAPLTSLASADGWAIFGLTTRHEVSRLTPSGAWTFHPDPAPDALIPVTDGSLVLASASGKRTRLARLRPPDARVLDTVSVPHAELVVSTEIGDRVYFLGDSGLAGVRVRDFSRTATVRLPDRAIDAVATPSGDRVYVALRGRKSVLVIDRYTESIEETIALAAAPTALRMDADGRYVLVRESAGDTVSVISVGTASVVARVSTTWRNDLPLTGPDGTLALVQGTDVLIVEAGTQQVRIRFPGGAADVWSLIRWNGFRPRAHGLDEPVSFAADSDSSGSARSADTSAVAIAPPGAAVDLTKVPVPEPAEPTAARDRRPVQGVKQIFTLSFATLLSEERADQMAKTIRLDGKPARVVPSSRDGTAMFRVVFGPFESREEADRAGRRSGLPYWVLEGAP